MPGRKQIPSFKLATGTTNERDYSYNLNTLGSIFYNTDTSNVEVYHEDPSNTVGWRDLVMNNKEQIDISGKLVVKDDVSFNAHLSAVDASFQNNVTVLGNLYVDGSFNFGEVIQNITTVNNELLISTQVDISNHGTGPALKVSQYGDGAGNQLAVFDAGEQGVAFEIMYDGDSVFHKDVSFQNNVDISGSLVVDGDVSFNAHLSVLDASFENNVDISGSLVVVGDLNIMGLKRTEVPLAGAGALDGTGGTNNVNGTASSSTVFYNNVTAYGPVKAFNGTLIDYNDTWASDPPPTGTYNYIQFKFPYDVIVTKYKIWRKPRPIYGYDWYPLAWKLKGSNDGVTFVEIDVKTAIAADWTATPVSNSIIHDSERNEYDVDDTTTAYSTIRMEISSHQGNYVAIGELAFYGYKTINTGLVVNGEASFQNNVDISGEITSQGLIFNHSTVAAHLAQTLSTGDSGGTPRLTRIDRGSGRWLYWYDNETGTDYTNNASGPGFAANNLWAKNGGYVGSDDRIKDNEKFIVNATETLSNLTPQIYDKYPNMNLSGNPIVESGLIAQEVYYNAPELRHLVMLGEEYDASGNDITQTPDEMDLSELDIANDPDYGSHGWSKTRISALNYQGLIPYLIKSNQELVERIETLKTENTELKTDISFMKTENTEQKGEIIQLTTDISLIRNHIGI